MVQEYLVFFQRFYMYGKQQWYEMFCAIYRVSNEDGDHMALGS